MKKEDIIPKKLAKQEKKIAKKENLKIRPKIKEEEPKKRKMVGVWWVGNLVMKVRPPKS